MNDNIHERKIIMYPSFKLIVRGLRTNMNGKIPTVKVNVKLMSSAANALSFPFPMDTRIDRNMKNALASNAKPTFLDMTFRFISRPPGYVPSFRENLSSS